MRDLPERTRRPLRKLFGGVRRRFFAHRDGSAPVPTYFKLEMARPCNLRCLHCGNWQEAPGKGRLPAEKWLLLIREIAAWAAPCHLTISSGEPLLDPDIFPVIKAAQDSGITVSLVSNGTLLGRKEAERFRNAGLRNLILSLDGIKPETHDQGRGVPGTHHKALRALEHLEAEGLTGKTQIQTIIAAHNLGELEALTRWTADKRLSGIRFQALQARGRSWKELWPADAERVSQTLEMLVRLKKEGAPILNPRSQLEAMKRYYRDPAALFPELECRCSDSISVGETGEAYCCRHMEPIGNLASAPLRSIWSSRAAAERLGAVRACHKSCLLLNCHFQTARLR